LDCAGAPGRVRHHPHQPEDPGSGGLGFFKKWREHMPNAKRNDPYAQFNFLIELNGKSVGGFTEVGGLSLEQDVIEYREGRRTDRAQAAR
jgi:hypothetical protein